MLTLLLKAALVASLVFTTVGVLLSRAVQPPNLEGLQLLIKIQNLGDHGYYIINMDGSNPQRLRMENQIIYHFMCSLNGQYAAMITSDGTLHVIQADGTPIQQFKTSHLDWLTSIGVSDDGRQVVVQTRDLESDRTDVLMFNQANPLGEVIFTGTEVYAPYLSPDSNRIAVAFDKAGMTNIAVLYVSEAVVSIVPSAAQDDILLRWSSDGNFIGRTFGDNRVYSYFLLDLNTLRKVRLYADTDKDYSSPTWSPDGLGFIMSTNGAELLLYNLAGRLLRTVTPQVEGEDWRFAQCFLIARPQSLIAAS